MALVLVSGAVANKPRSGGEAWVRMSWVRGLRALGCEVAFVEQLDPAACVDDAGHPAPFATSLNRRVFESVLADLGPGCPASLICGTESAGLDQRSMVALARDADVLINISGHLEIEAIKAGPRRRAYVDVDPGFTQIWGDGARLDGHDLFFTVGENIGTPGCTIPTGGLDWRPLPPPVTLDDWPATPVVAPGRFTTVTTWRSPLGALALDEVVFPGKHHQWREVLDLPRRSPWSFELAIDIHAEDDSDRRALEAAGWRLRDPRIVAGDPSAFRAYVRGSGAEFSVAHGAYVQTASGWISDRTVRYLASGRPALVQDTGVGRRYPLGEGLVTFRSLAEAAERAEAIVRDHASHAGAARALAEQHFAAEVVLGRLLEQVGVR